MEERERVTEFCDFTREREGRQSGLGYITSEELERIAERQRRHYRIFTKYFLIYHARCS